MRRKDREMNQSFAEGVADKCEWATLAMIDAFNRPYALPISIVREGDVIYFHSANGGKKTDCLKKNNDVCVTCVGHTQRALDEFTTEFESAIVFGKAFEVLDCDEKVKALRLLCLRHVPTNMSKFESEIERSLKLTAVWKIEIDEISGKRKKYDEGHNEMKFGRN